MTENNRIDMLLNLIIRICENAISLRGDKLSLNLKPLRGIIDEVETLNNDKAPWQGGA